MENIITKKIDKYLNQKKLLQTEDYYTKKQKIEKALHLSIKITDRKRTLKSYLALSVILLKMNDYNNSLVNITKAFHEYKLLKEKDQTLLFEIYLISSEIHIKLKKYKSSSDELFSAILIYQDINDDETYFDSLNKIIRIFWENRKFLSKIKKIPKFKKIINTKKKTEFLKRIIVLLKEENRTKFYNKLIDFYNFFSYRTKKDTESIITFHQNLSLLNQEIGKNKTALIEIDKAISLCSDDNVLEMKIFNLIEKAKIKWKMKKFDEALKIIDNLPQTIIIHIEIYLKIYKLKYWIYLGKKDYKQSFICFKKYSDLRKHYFKKINDNKLKNLKIQYDIQKYKNEVRTTKRENELHINHKYKLQSIIEKRTEKIMDMEKFYEVGKFSASIIHNIKNPLASLIGIQEILKKKVETNPEIQKYVDMLSTPLKQIKDMMESITSSVRNKKHGNLVDIDLNKTLKEVIQFKNFDKYFNKEISCIMNLYPKIPIIKGKEIQFRQIFDNLLNNAVDAMKNSITKRIEITTTFDKKNITIEIKDYGTGISKNDIKNIFKSEFTTKHKGEGTGLGLSITKMMIENMNGDISVKSKINSGTTFVINIPYTSKN